MSVCLQGNWRVLPGGAPRQQEDQGDHGGDHPEEGQARHEDHHGWPSGI